MVRNDFFFFNCGGGGGGGGGVDSANLSVRLRSSFVTVLDTSAETCFPFPGQVLSLYPGFHLVVLDTPMRIYILCGLLQCGGKKKEKEREREREREKEKKNKTREQQLQHQQKMLARGRQSTGLQSPTIIYFVSVFCFFVCFVFLLNIVSLSVWLAVCLSLCHPANDANYVDHLSTKLSQKQARNALFGWWISTRSNCVSLGKGILCLVLHEC